MRPLAAGSVFLFASGFCALVYQTVWLRELRGILGASTPATSAVLALFMGGLGFGALVLGRRVDQSRSPLTLYGSLELVISGLAAVSPFLLELVKGLYLGVGGSQALGLFATPVRILLAAVVMFLPAFLMGGTLPAMAQAIRQDSDVTRKTLALVYGTNTLGAVVGVLCTSFVFFEVFGLRSTLWLAAGVNAILGIVARSVGRTWTSATPSESSPAAQPVSHPGLLVAAFAAGCAFLMFELVWYRLMAPVLGGTTYSFSIILAMALLGIGLGGLLYALVPPTPSWRILGLTCWLEALLLVGPFAIGDDYLFLAHHIREFAMASFGLLVGSWVVTLCWFVLPAAVVSGYQFPLLIALVAEHRLLGADTGRVYAANTLGAIVGSLLGGLVLIPTIGAHETGVLAAGLLAVVGTVSVWRGAGGARLRIAALVVSAAACLVLLSLRGPGATWATTAVGVGRAGIPPSTTRDRVLRHRATAAGLISQVDGIESTVAATTSTGYSLMVNGKSDGNSHVDAETQIGATLLATILRSRPVEDAFVIGLGTGQSAGWLGAVPFVQHVDVAEIEPAVLDFVDLCRDTNHDVLKNPKVNVIIGDGRELLQVSPRRFDLVMSEPSNPYRAGLAGFYSSDFYRLAAQKLTEDGVFVQWMQGYEIEAGAVQAAIATIKGEFGNVTIWQLGSSDLVFMASRAPMTIDLDVVRDRMSQEPFRSAFERVFLFDRSDDIFSLFVGTDALAAQLADAWQGGLNTDDLPVLEFAFSRSVGRKTPPVVTALTALAKQSGNDTLVGLDVDWARARAIRDAKATLGTERPVDAALVGRVGALQRSFLGESLMELQEQMPIEARAAEFVRMPGHAERTRLFDQVVADLRRDPWLHRTLDRPLGLVMLDFAYEGGEAAAPLLAEPFLGGRLEVIRREAFLLTHSKTPRASCVGDFDGSPAPWTAALVELKARCFTQFAPGRADDPMADLADWQAGEPSSFTVDGGGR